MRSLTSSYGVGSRSCTPARSSAPRRSPVALCTANWWSPTPASRSRRSTDSLTGSALPLVRSPAGHLTVVGEQIGIGDRVATRRSDTDLGVANLELWAFAGAQNGALEVVGDAGRRTLPVHYAIEHVELAYASTAYGAQGSTVPISARPAPPSSPLMVSIATARPHPSDVPQSGRRRRHVVPRTTSAIGAGVRAGRRDQLLRELTPLPTARGRAWGPSRPTTSSSGSRYDVHHEPGHR